MGQFLPKVQSPPIEGTLFTDATPPPFGVGNHFAIGASIQFFPADNLPPRLSTGKNWIEDCYCKAAPSPMEKPLVKRSFALQGSAGKVEKEAFSRPL